MPWILKDQSLLFYILVQTQSFILQYQDVLKPMLLSRYREFGSEILVQGISSTMLNINSLSFSCLQFKETGTQETPVFFWGSSQRLGKLPKWFLKWYQTPIFRQLNQTQNLRQQFGCFYINGKRQTLSESNSSHLKRVFYERGNDLQLGGANLSPLTMVKTQLLTYSRQLIFRCLILAEIFVNQKRQSTSVSD